MSFKALENILLPSQKILLLKYPLIYTELYSSSAGGITAISFLKHLENNQIEIFYSETAALNDNYKGTFNCRIKLKNSSHLRSLERSKNSFTYYGFSTLENAAEKAIFKSFEILECLKAGKTLPVTPRKRFSQH